MYNSNGDGGDFLECYGSGYNDGYESGKDGGFVVRQMMTPLF